MFCFADLPKNEKALITSCCCDERIEMFGFRVGEIIEIVEECPFGGTVIVKTRLGFVCVRRNEINLLCKRE